MNTAIKTKLIYYAQKSTTAVGFFVAICSAPFMPFADEYGFLFITSVFAVFTVLCDQTLTRFFKITEDSNWLQNKGLTSNEIQQFFNNRRAYRLAGAIALCVCWLFSGAGVFLLIAPFAYFATWLITANRFYQKGWGTHLKVRTCCSYNQHENWLEDLWEEHNRRARYNDYK